MSNTIDPIVQKVYYILKRFHSSYKLIRNPHCNNPNVLYNIKDIYVIGIYKRNCIYSNDRQNSKEHLVIKYKYQNNPETISLNLPLEKYNDLLKYCLFKNLFNIIIPFSICYK